MVICKYCNRNFDESRLDKHESICANLSSSTRKMFVPSKHRLSNTESVVNNALTSQPSNTTQTNWRKNHEEFIATVREARKVQSFLAKGGKVSDLPPPKPSLNPDYVQCPTCSRRFNQEVAARHIPICANSTAHKPTTAKTNSEKTLASSKK